MSGITDPEWRARAHPSLRLLDLEHSVRVGWSVYMGVILVSTGLTWRLTTAYYASFPRWDLLVGCVLLSVGWAALAGCAVFSHWGQYTHTEMYRHAVTRARAQAHDAVVTHADALSAPPLPYRLPSGSAERRRRTRLALSLALSTPLLSLVAIGPAERGGDVAGLSARVVIISSLCLPLLVLVALWIAVRSGERHADRWLDRVTPEGYALRVHGVAAGGYDTTDGQARGAPSALADASRAVQTVESRGTRPCLLLRTPDADVPFLVAGPAAAHLYAAALSDLRGWLYLRPPLREPGPNGAGTRERWSTPAVLIGDDGEMVRGALPLHAAWDVAEYGTSPVAADGPVTPGAPLTSAARSVVQPNWKGGWPMMWGPASVLVSGIGLLAAAGALSRLPGGWGAAAALTFLVSVLVFPWARARDNSATGSRPAPG